MSGTDTSEQVDEVAWEQAAVGVDVDVVRALRATGVRIEHLGRAAKFLDRVGTDTVESLKRQAEYLRDDLPSLFTAAAPAAADTDAAAAASTKTSGVAKGREEARRLGWIKA